MNRLIEGWACPLDSHQWHYFVGLSDLGGRFRSLCGRHTMNAGSTFRQIVTRQARCRDCREAIEHANRTSSPSQENLER